MKAPRHATLWKKVGETPLMALEAFKAREGINAPACYAGRLDPMAEGKLLILVGEECKRLSRYTGLDKEYEIDVLLGAGSDTGDALGLPVLGEEVAPVNLLATLRQEVGEHERPYPAYSSKTVGGKPLFLHALEGTLPELPTHTECIYRIRHLATATLSSKELLARVLAHLSHAPRTDDPRKELGRDFRQDEIRERWRELLIKERMFTVLSLRVTCGSGTYMRSLAERIGEACGTRALALSIKRTRIGKYWKGFWLLTY